MEKINFNKEHLIAEFEFPALNQSGYSNFVSIIMECKTHIQSGKPEIILDPNFFSKNMADRFKEIQLMISDAKPLIEKIDDLLFHFLSIYFSKNDIKTYEERFHNFNRLDFMGRRDLLSLVIKKDKSFEAIEELSTKEVSKKFTKQFCDLITDRNILTHGQLQLRYPENFFVLKFRNKEGEYEHSKVDAASIKDYNNSAATTFDVLNKLIQKQQHA